MNVDGQLGRTSSTSGRSVTSRRRLSSWRTWPSREGYAVAERIAGETVPEIDYVNIPRVTYCTPEIASVGLTAQAKDRGHQLATEQLDFRAIGKANMLGEGDREGRRRAGRRAGPRCPHDRPARHRPDRRGDAHHELGGGAGRGRRADPPAPTLSEAIGEAHLALVGKPPTPLRSRVATTKTSGRSGGRRAAAPGRRAQADAVSAEALPVLRRADGALPSGQAARGDLLRPRAGGTHVGVVLPRPRTRCSRPTATCPRRSRRGST